MKHCHASPCVLPCGEDELEIHAASFKEPALENDVPWCATFTATTPRNQPTIRLLSHITLTIVRLICFCGNTITYVGCVILKGVQGSHKMTIAHAASSTGMMDVDHRSRSLVSNNLLLAALHYTSMTQRKGCRVLFLRRYAFAS